VLVNLCVAVVVTLIGLAVHSHALIYLYTLAVFMPSLGVAVRRLHDIDRSGWWVLISLVPIIGPIILIVLAATKGTSGENRFGMDPLQSGLVAA